MRALLLVAILLAPLGCKRPRAAEKPNNDPYRNVTPQKVKQKVEDIQKKEDELNDKRMEQMKE